MKDKIEYKLISGLKKLKCKKSYKITSKNKFSIKYSEKKNLHEIESIVSFINLYDEISIKELNIKNIR